MHIPVAAPCSGEGMRWLTSTIKNKATGEQILSPFLLQSSTSSCKKPCCLHEGCLLLHGHLKQHQGVELVKNSRADPAGYCVLLQQHRDKISHSEMIELQKCSGGRSSVHWELAAQTGFIYHLLGPFFSFVGWGEGRQSRGERRSRKIPAIMSHQSLILI